MVDVRGYTAGTFNWIELGTADRGGAKQFYAGLMGWEASDHPAIPGGAYLLLQHRGRTVGGLYELSDAQKSGGIAPHWMSYVAVKSADESVQQAEKLGGTVIAPPFDAMADRRVAILSDPAGATFAVWEAKPRHGADVAREPGSVGWTELITHDAQSSTAFYTGLFGWTASSQDVGGGATYTSFTVGKFPNCGMMARPEHAGKVPPHWMVYLQVVDCDAAAKKVTELGGRLRVNPTNVPNLGRFAMIQDPQGAACSIIAFGAGG